MRGRRARRDGDPLGDTGADGRRPSGSHRLQHDQGQGRAVRREPADLALPFAERRALCRGQGRACRGGAEGMIMRGQIIDAVFERMASNPDVFFLTADMGINLIEKFAEKYPTRFLNVGIAEQNLVGVSAGLANLGFRPFAYTISNFAIHRCFEQIRNDIGIHDYPIVLLGTSTGYDNAPLGPTHHVIDDWGALKAIPEIDIYCPSSVSYAGFLVDHLLSTGRPAYVRIPKGAHKAPASTDHFVMLPGGRQDTILVSYGTCAQDCLAAQSRDPALAVLVVNRLRPLDDEKLADALRPY